VPSDLERAVKRFRGSLLAQDASSRAAVRRSYRVAVRALRADLAATLARMADLRASGVEVPAWRILAEQRTRQLLARAEMEFARFGDVVEAEAIRRQQGAIQRAQQDAARLIETAFGSPPPGATLPIHLLPTQALTELTAAVQPDAPVRRLLEEFAGDARAAVEAELIGGMARGESPRVIGRAITKRLGKEQSVRAQRIVRTELMRAYREASRATYVENKHLMRGWIWYSGLNARTCAVCIGLHGRRFDVETKMATHPACRCVLLPQTKSWKDLGYDVPDTRAAIPTGPEVFAGWSAADQRAVLGPGAFAAYQAGDVTLADFVGNTRSQVWGSGRRRVSLATARQRSKKADRAVPWTPSMTAEQADAWSSQSTMKSTLFHGTSETGVESIPRDGFDLSLKSNGKFFGNGVYLAENQGLAQTYADFAEGDVLMTRINVRKVLHITEDVNWDNESGTLGAFAHVSPNGSRLIEIANEIQEERFALEKRRDEVFDIKRIFTNVEAQEIQEQLDEFRFKDPHAAAITQFAKEEGIDAIRIDNGGDRDTNIWVVFDSKNVTVVKE